jgi:hypothetical protein
MRCPPYRPRAAVQPRDAAGARGVV